MGSLAKKIGSYGATWCGSELGIVRAYSPESRTREPVWPRSSNNPNRNERKENASNRSKIVCAIGESSRPRNPQVAAVSAINNEMRARLNML